MEPLLDRLTEDSQWLPIAMLLAAAASKKAIERRSEAGLAGGDVGLAALGRFHGTMILVMGIGHFVAITILAARGDLVGAPWLLYSIGLLIVAPAAYLFHQATGALDPERYRPSRLLAANVWIFATLVLLGLHNLPLAIPALLTIAYQRTERPGLRRVIFGVAVAGYLALFAGALVFMASGQSFEQFTGIE